MPHCIHAERKSISENDWEGNPPAMHDDYGVPIYCGDTYYDLDGWIISEKSLEQFKKECNTDGNT